MRRQNRAIGAQGARRQEIRYKSPEEMKGGKELAEETGNERGRLSRPRQENR